MRPFEGADQSFSNHRCAVAYAGLRHVVHQFFRQEEPLGISHRLVGFGTEEQVDACVRPSHRTCISADETAIGRAGITRVVRMNGVA